MYKSEQFRQNGFYFVRAYNYLLEQIKQIIRDFISRSLCRAEIVLKKQILVQ